ncbi:hypothetical protein [Hyphomicrobium sp. D-2]|uniref:hypothetical protein n=1 Tax=Hyphomicrobium sp. D-2 TaxID=3041621 RepID=UPI002458261B|nr:hypothetical protein [Hyphomicrobium sp. D-2]MDH4983263.1 hypothetical protein [Hyphomicrobium sp. D-2]
MTVSALFVPAATAANFASLIGCVRSVERTTAALLAECTDSAMRIRAIDDLLSCRFATQQTLDAMLERWRPLGESN